MSPRALSCCFLVIASIFCVSAQSDFISDALGFAAEAVADRVKEEVRDSLLDGVQGAVGNLLSGALGGQPSEAPPPPETYYDVGAEGYVPASTAGSDSKFGAKEVWNSLTNTFVGGIGDLVKLRPACSTGATGIFTGCGDQFQHLIAEMGYPLFYPKVTPEKLTPEFLATVPVPDYGSVCCVSARIFQGARCACDVETIQAMRDMGMFDPEMTVKFADYLYGDLCGANTFLADDCPSGSPFDKLRGR